MYFNKILFVLMLLLFSISCSSTKTSSPVSDSSGNRILIYGTTTCGICIGTKKRLDEEKIVYTFYDIDDNSSANSEMWSKVRKAKWYKGGSVGIPIVDVNGNVFQQPSLDQIKSNMRK